MLIFSVEELVLIFMATSLVAGMPSVKPPLYEVLCNVSGRISVFLHQKLDKEDRSFEEAVGQIVSNIEGWHERARVFREEQDWAETRHEDLMRGLKGEN